MPTDNPGFMGLRQRLMADPQGMMNQAGQEYPAIGKHPFQVIQGQGQHYSEFYPPDETYNPRPGMPTIELYDKARALQPKGLKSLLLGESLHHMGGMNPMTEQPVDPTYRSLKMSLMNQLTPQQLTADRLQYRSQGDPRPFDQWMDQSGMDAYIRANLFPVHPAEKKEFEITNPEGTGILNQMKQYLQTGQR